MGNLRRWIRNEIISFAVACSGMHRRGNVANAVHVQPWRVTCDMRSRPTLGRLATRFVVFSAHLQHHLYTPRSTYKMSASYRICSCTGLLVPKVLRDIPLLAGIRPVDYEYERSTRNRRLFRSRKERKCMGGNTVSG